MKSSLHLYALKLLQLPPHKINSILLIPPKPLNDKAMTNTNKNSGLDPKKSDVKAVNKSLSANGNDINTPGIGKQTPGMTSEQNMGKNINPAPGEATGLNKISGTVSSTPAKSVPSVNKGVGRGRKKWKNTDDDPFADLNSGWEADEYESSSPRSSAGGYDDSSEDMDEGYNGRRGSSGRDVDDDSDDQYESFRRG
jgi:hypothetical protein